MNHHHIDRRVARSAECSTAGRSPTEPHEIERLARQARAAGVIVFTKPMLDRMPEMARQFIETEHKRSCEGL